jgi:hypothetical protein
MLDSRGIKMKQRYGPEPPKACNIEGEIKYKQCQDNIVRDTKDFLTRYYESLEEGPLTSLGD